MINHRLRTFDSVIETCRRKNTTIKTYHSRKKFDDVCSILDHQFYLIKQELLSNPKIQIIKNKNYFDIKYVGSKEITYLGELKRNNLTSSYSMNISPALTNETLKVMKNIAYFANAIKEWDNDSANLTEFSNKWDSDCSSFVDF